MTRFGARTVSSTLVTLGGVVLVTMLSACSPASPAPEAAPTPSAAAPSPSASLVPKDPEDLEDTETELFTVAARVRAIDGTSMDIAMTAHEALASTADEASDLVETFVRECAAVGGRSASNAAMPLSEETLSQYGSSLLRVDVISTPDDLTFVAPVDLGFGSQYSAEIVTGDAIQPIPANEICPSRYQMTGSGSAVAIVNYESGDGLPDLSQWAYGHYGFSVPFTSGASIESCRVELTDAAERIVDEVPGWGLGSDATGISCGIGYVGE